MAGITKLFKADLDPTRVAAIIFEPVQGEGGFYPAPKELVKAIRKLCDDLRDLSDVDPIITIDQEGGRVARMKPPVWAAYPPGERFDRLYDLAPASAIPAATLAASNSSSSAPIASSQPRREPVVTTRKLPQLPWADHRP